LIFGFLLPTLLLCQSDPEVDTIYLDPVSIQATKIEQPWLKSSNSVTPLSPTDKEQLAQNSLQEYLLESPSIFSLNAFNRAQDLRISIRGFGSRANFGVRGVKIIVDGIPETTTDGQGQLDNLNLGIIEQMEVLNNGSGALYGNASGGVIQIRTLGEEAFQKKNHFAHLGIGFHAFQGQQYQATAGTRWGKNNLIIHANHHQAEGYREQSAFQSTNFNLRYNYRFSKKSKLTAILNYMNSPKAEDPGGVSLDLFEQSPRSARDANVEFRTGEEIDQLKASLQFNTPLNKHLHFNTYAFYSYRNFNGRLPFTFGGNIDLLRHFFGQGASLQSVYRWKKVKWRSNLNAEWSSQQDTRMRFENLSGDQGAQTLNQDERFTNVGLSWIHNLAIEKWIVDIAIRYDINQVKLINRFNVPTPRTQDTDLNNFNYSIGIAYPLSLSKSLFASYSTSFETPTLNELSSNPLGVGFNQALQPQTANHIEFGIKGFFGRQTRFQSSIFFVQTQDEIIPFEINIPNQGIFTSFQNAGSTDRIGAEIRIQHRFNATIQASTNWSYHHFTFSTFDVLGENFEGNRLPGLPNVMGNVMVQIKPYKRFNILLQNQFFGKIYTDNANSEAQSAKSILNLSFRYRYKAERFTLLPYFGINNILGTRYADNIRINAFGGRFYESAPQQFWFGGIRLKI